MMRLPKFRYLAPKTISQAAQMLSDGGSEAMVVAGGTDLFPNMKRLQQTPRTVIGLRGVQELRLVEGTLQTGLRVGACLTLTEAQRHPLLRKAYPALVRATELISTPILQNMGTLGGNLCLDTRCNYYNQTYEWRKAIDFCLKRDGHICWVATSSPKCWAVNSSDTAPVAVALGARLKLVSIRAERLVSAGDFFRDDGIQYLSKAPDEILTEIHLPPPDGWRCSYLKLRRRGSFDFPVLGVAAAVRLDSRGICLDARIVAGAIAPRPIELDKAAEHLLGHPLTPERIAGAAKMAEPLAKPLDNTDFDVYWRRKMTSKFVERALREL